MVISDDQKIADIFTEYFETIVPILGLAIPKDAIFTTNGIEDPVCKAVHKYQMLPSILGIKEKYKNLIFYAYVSLSNLQNQLKSLDFSKSVLETDIPAKVLKQNMEIFSPFLFLPIISIT